MAERFRLAGDNAFHSTECWPALVERGIVGFMEVNTLPPLMSPGDRAGVVGRWISLGHFALDPGQALLVEVGPTSADYVGIQLSDLWFASLPYGNATSSLSGEQSVIGSDGRTYYVVSAEDPGYPNWLDPCGLDRGTVHLRFDGVDGEIPRASWPTATVVDVADVPSLIPGFADEAMDDTARRDQLSLIHI